MKHSKFYIILLMISISFNFLSCDNEPIDPALLIENPEACDDVSLFSVSDFVDGTKVNLNWDANGDTFQIQYGPKGFALGSGTALTSADNHLTVSGLDNTKEYDFYIRNVCGATSFSEWVGPVSVGSISINICQAPSNIVVARSASPATTANVSWTATGVSQWEIQYGPTGFTLGSGTVATATAATHQVLGLSELSGYDFYVRSVCSATSKSTWAGPIQLAPTTAPVTSDYWPLALNNQWVYSISGTAQPAMKVVSIDVIEGKTYHTMAGGASVGGATATQRVRKLNGDYYVKIEAITTPPSGGVPSGTTSGNETIYLKDYLNVGGSWTDNYIQTTTYSGIPPITMNVSVVSTIEEKNVSLTVSGETYPTVIKVKRVMTSTLMGTDSVSTSYFWFAKDVGVIRVENPGYAPQLLESYILN